MISHLLAIAAVFSMLFSSIFFSIASIEVHAASSSSEIVHVHYHAPLTFDHEEQEEEQTLPTQSDQPLAACNVSQGSSQLKKHICALFHQQISAAALLGYERALKHCRHQLANERWNCTLVRRKEGVYVRHEDGALPHGLRGKEAAFYYAIAGAGIAYDIAKACAAKKIDTCIPDKPYDERASSIAEHPQKLSTAISQQSENRKRELLKIPPLRWRWWPGPLNVKFTWRHSKQLFNETFRNLSFNRLQLHNMNIGREVVENLVQLSCNCHGVSGACTTALCWKKLPNFTVVAKRLKQLYNQAEVAENGKKRLNETGRQRKSQTGLWYSRKTKFCVPNSRQDVLGMRGRVCRKEDCSQWCCNGFHDQYVLETSRCNCTFEWKCCCVRCRTCEERRLRRFCD